MTSNNLIHIQEKSTIECEKKSKIITIKHQTQNPNGDIFFDELYKIKVQNMNLMELLLFQSLFACTTQAEIIKLVESQPNQDAFFNSYDEINFSNMVTVLAFDNRTIEILLSSQINSNIKKSETRKYPLIYKIMNKKSKYETKSALDVALENN